MRYVHTVIGLVFFVVFLASGAWMRLNLPSPESFDIGARMMYRSAHIYILLSAMINLAATQAQAPVGLWRRRIWLTGGIAIAAAPALFSAAFLLESTPGVLKRPLCQYAAIAVMTGSLLRFATGSSLTSTSSEQA